MTLADTPTLSSRLSHAAERAAARVELARRLLSSAPVVLFGSGALGRTVSHGLREEGVDAAAFSDNDRTRWNQTIDGIPVLPPQQLDRDAVCVITIWNAGRRRNQSAVRRQLLDAGMRNVLSFADVYRAFPDRFLPYFAVDRLENVMQSLDAIHRVHDLLADGESRRIFSDQIEWRITADYDALPSPGNDAQYFPRGIVQLRDDETFVDCGAYDGDTLSQFLSLTKTFNHYWALEPDLKNFAALQSLVETLPHDVASRVTCIAAGASDHAGQERFDARGSASSTFSDSGTVTIDCVRLDDLMPSCTFIKLDVEGAEPKVLHGAARLIRQCTPVLAISAYHTQAHIWELPLLVHSMNPNYRLFYRDHNEEGFDLVLYATDGRT
jgi:FkbM family methyltransferase